MSDLTTKPTARASYRTFISTKGRVTIPAEFRERFRIMPGTIVTWREEQGRLVLTPLTKKRLSKIVEFSKPKLGHRDKS
jgi:AbrB family looped-hinge helix DNA binding protein